MATEYSIKTVIKASDQITSPMRQIMASTASAARRATEKISEGAKEATSHVFSLGEGVGLVSGALGALAGAVSIGGLAEMVKSYAESTSELYHLSEQLHVSVQDLREFRYAADFSGVGVDAMTASLEFLNKGVGQAEGGYGRLAKALSRTPNGRVLLEQLKGAKDTSAAFDLATQAVSKIRNPMQQAALATALFGGNAKDMIRLSKGGVDAIDKLRAQARQDIGVITPEMVEKAHEFDQSMKRLGYQFKSVGGVVARELMPVLQPALDQFREWASANRAVIKVKIAEMVRDLAKWIQSVDWAKVATGARDFGTAVLKVVTMLGGFKTAIYGIGAYLALGWTISIGKALFGLGQLATALGPAAIGTGGSLLVIAASIGVITYELIQAWNAYQKFSKTPSVPKTKAASEFAPDPFAGPANPNARIVDLSEPYKRSATAMHTGRGPTGSELGSQLWRGITGQDSRTDAAAAARPQLLQGGRGAAGGAAQNVQGEMVVRIESPDLKATVTSVKSSVPWFDVSGNVGASPAGSRF